MIFFAEIVVVMLLLKEETFVKAEIMQQYMMISGGFIPTAGYTTIAEPFSGSLGQCTMQCVKLGKVCSGFLFQPSNCSTDADQMRARRCTMMSLGDPLDVVLESSTCGQQLWLAKPYWDNFTANYGSILYHCVVRPS